MAIVRYTLDPNDLPRLSAEEKARVDVLTPEQIEQNARDDPDNPPSTDEELARGVAGRFVRLTRQSLGLSQVAFAERFRIGLPRLRDWEQGRFVPDSVAMAYLAVIARAPAIVDRALARRGEADSTSFVQEKTHG